MATSDQLTGLRRFPPLAAVEPEALEGWIDLFQPLDLSLGALLPSRLEGELCTLWLLDGVVRIAGPSPQQPERFCTLELRHGPAVFGAHACQADAAAPSALRLTISTPGPVWALPQPAFLRLLREQPSVAAWFRDRLELEELAPLLSRLPPQHLPPDPRGLRQAIGQIVHTAQPRECCFDQLPQLDERDGHWYVLRSLSPQLRLPAPLSLSEAQQQLQQAPPHLPLRVVQLPHAFGGPGERLRPQSPLSAPAAAAEGVPPDPWQLPASAAGASTPSAAPTEPVSAQPLPPLVSPEPDRNPEEPDREPFPVLRAEGQLNEAVACFRMLGRALDFPVKADVLAKILAEQIDRTGGLSLQLCAAVAEFLGLQTQLADVPADLIERVTTPALVLLGDELAVLYGTRPQEVLLGAPREGLVTREISRLMAFQPEDAAGLPVLLLRTLPSTPKARFGLQWFLPAIRKNRRALIEVLVASLFVQLFQLMNPLIIQQIIDKVIGQNGMSTLPVLGVLLVAFSLFENLLTGLRTNLFVDTTNRIDISLGEVIIDHLLKLPLNYFDRRPVGELSSRLGEMENIRSFLTGTALTVVLDSVFSVIYILVMLVYSWVLTIVALLVVPALALITIGISPVVRDQLRVKAELNAKTQSHLVEVLSGIQTVKAQNFELKARWKWKENYSRFVAEGFRNAMTATTANALTNFLNQLSNLLVICVGAWLVLEGQLTLGGLIAFRIIAGYVTGPLLRLVQLWQSFQQTSLSLERLADIIDTPQESELVDRTNIPMPEIQGNIVYEDLCFRFGKEGPLQLANVSVAIQPGQFVAIVGQSGSGKSTLTKLLPRLYPPLSGRIFIDGFDIAKVELYSLRRQIGIVPQDSLLFEGSVQDNIGLTNPEATSEDIITAAKIACAHDFIMQLPMGYNTPVGERGGSLSGGQRQRIAIARTVLQNPRILIMDEATSALDLETERRVSLNLMEALRGRTVLFITHRLSSIRGADRILLMHEGALVEDGSHDELMERRGRYYALYRQQEATGEGG